MGPKLDEFTLSMNRATEISAPLAADIFSTAITETPFDDASKTFQGGNTAATEYLKTRPTPNRLIFSAKGSKDDELL